MRRSDSSPAGDSTVPTSCGSPTTDRASACSRSPENVNAKGPAPDLRAIQTVDQVFTDSVPAVPFVTLSVFPLEDVPGYDVDVHFRVSQGLKIVNLKNYRGVFYDFDNDRFAWTDTVGVSPTALPFPTTALPLAATLALADTVSSEAMEPVGDGFGLYLREPTSTSTFELVLEEDFLLPANGAPGQATLVTVIGGMEAFGAAAYFTSGGTTFRDLNVPDWTATTVEPGYLLRILNGDAEGVYTVTSVFAAELVVDPPFPASASASLGYAQWRIYEGLTRDVYDPAVLADVILDPFNHFPSEPFVIRVLSPLGDVSTDPITAPVATAVDSGRVFSVRFTPQDSLEYVAADEALPTLLRRGVSIGAYSQTGLFVPDLSDPHFALSSGLAAYFSIRVGATVYSTEAGNLTVVTTGTSPRATCWRSSKARGHSCSATRWTAPHSPSSTIRCSSTPPTSPPGRSRWMWVPEPSASPPVTQHERSGTGCTWSSR